jgi:hypothetical protein
LLEWTVFNVTTSAAICNVTKVVWSLELEEKIHPRCQDWSAIMITDCQRPPAEAIARSSKTIFELAVAKLGGGEVFQARKVVLETSMLLG